MALLFAGNNLRNLGSSLNASDPGSHVSCSHILGLKRSNFMLHLPVVWFLKEQLFDRSASCSSWWCQFFSVYSRSNQFRSSHIKSYHPGHFNSPKNRSYRFIKNLIFMNSYHIITAPFVSHHIMSSGAESRPEWPGFIEVCHTFKKLLPLLMVDTPNVWDMIFYILIYIYIILYVLNIFFELVWIFWYTPLPGFCVSWSKIVWTHFERRDWSLCLPCSFQSEADWKPWVFHKPS